MINRTNSYFLKKSWDRSFLQLSAILLLIFCFQVVKANPVDTTLKHHVVILLDRSGSVVNNRLDEDLMEIESIIQEELPDLLMDPNIPRMKNAGRPLLQQGDYISILSFGFERNRPDAQKFIETKAGTNQFGLLYEEVVGDGKSYFNRLWENIDQINDGRNRFFNKNWTGLSFAGPLSVHFLGKQEDLPNDVHRTFVVMLSDDQFNGTADPTQEINYIGSDERGYTPVLNKSTILPRYDEVREIFSWQRFTGRTNGVYNFEIFEYIPLQPTFAIEALLPIEMEWEFSRSPEGNYTYDLPLKPYDTSDDFKIERLVLTCVNMNTQGVLFSKTINKLYDNQEVLLELDKSYIDKDLQMKLQAWVWYDNDVYGVHTLHPYGDRQQGSKGLSRDIKILTERTAKILGILSLSDGLYKASQSFGKNQYEVARIWSAIIIIILVVSFIIYLIRSSVQKRPSKTSI